MSLNLGNLKTVDPRTIWKSESRDFTPWLSKNLQMLGDILEMELETINTEVSVGDFSADILAKDLGTGSDVIIENQFGATDHDHLGKILTYASGMDAGVLIWIAEEIREEHRQALEWLNERTDQETMLFGIVLEVIQIDESMPAVNFKRVVFPNKWQKATRIIGHSGNSVRAEVYRRYFQELIDELREKYKFTGAKIAQPHSWYSYSSGITGITYGTSFALGGRARAEITLALSSKEETKKLFDWLALQRDQIEKDFGNKLEWERLDDKQSSRIAIYRSGTIDDESTWKEIQKWMIDNMLNFKKVFPPLLESYKD